MDDLKNVNVDYQWILKIINTSFTHYHFNSCVNLIDTFRQRHPKYENMAEILSNELKIKVDNEQEDNKNLL